MNLRNFMVVAGALLAVTSCQGEQSFEEDKVLGPAGTDVTQRPVTEIPLLTAVLEASKMNGMEVVDPRLTVFGQCRTDQGCSDASDVLTSLRF